MLTLRPWDDKERRAGRFGLLRMLQLCAAILLCTVMGMSQANAQTAVVTAGSPNTSAGSGTVTYSASVAITNPALTSEQQIINVTYAWGSSDTCNPTTSSSTTVTAQRSSPGASSSTVGCTVTWYIYNTYTKQTTTASAGGGATVNFTLGVLWSPGTITGGILTSPQNQTSTPYVPTVVVTSSGTQLTCTVSNATATDTSTFNGTPTTANDTVSYAWTASAGTLGSPSSASTSWTAPTTPQTSAVTVTCTISATAPAVVSPDGGTRGPSSKSATVKIYIPTLTVTGGSWSPNPAYVGQILTCHATASVTPSVPGAVDNVTWQSTKSYQSLSGSDPFSSYSGSSGWVYTQGSLSTSFTGFFNDPGYYLIGVGAIDTLKDSNGYTLGSVSGTGFVGGGTLADILPPDGTYGQQGAHIVRAHDAPQAANGVPVQPADTITVQSGATVYRNSYSTTTLTVTVNDSNNTAVPNATVSFSISPGAIVGPATATTNASGQVTMTVRSTDLSPTDETATATATANGGTGTATVTFKGALQIYANSTNKTNQTTPCMVGEMQALTLNILGSPTVTNATWSASGATPIGGWSAGSTATTTTAFPPDANSHTYAHLYLTTTGSDTTTLTATVSDYNGSPVTGTTTTTFTVSAPTDCSLIATQAAPVPGTGVIALYLGNAKYVGDTGTFGITFSASGGSGGTYTFAQILNSRTVTATGSTGPQNFKNPGTPGLDGGYPHATRSSGHTDDTPGVSTTDTTVTELNMTNFSATMYLLWTSSKSSSIPIPVISCLWTWNGDATFDADGNGTLKPGASPASSPTCSPYSQGVLTWQQVAPASLVLVN